MQFGNKNQLCTRVYFLSYYGHTSMYLLFTRFIVFTLSTVIIYSVVQMTGSTNPLFFAASKLHKSALLNEPTVYSLYCGGVLLLT